MTALRIAFFGLPLAACLLLQDGHDLVAAVLPPVEGPGRRRLRARLAPTSPLVDLLSGDPAPDLEALLARVRPDLIVSWFWTRRFTAGQLGQARLGGIGAHPSLLPRHRGPNPYFAAIDAGDRVTGVTIHRLTERYDEGAILAQESLLVGESDSWQLARRLDRPSLRQLRATVARMARGEPLVETPQDEAAATWAPDPQREPSGTAGEPGTTARPGALLRVDWTWSTERILRRIRALALVPGLALELSGERFFVLAAEPAEDYPRALRPGEGAVFGTPPDVVLRTGDGAVRVLLAQLASPGESPSDATEAFDDGAALVCGEAASGGAGSPETSPDETGAIVTGQELAARVARR